jgi:hypothetical protein
LRDDDGFEDREGHQAPFTLRGKENAKRRTLVRCCFFNSLFGTRRGPKCGTTETEVIRELLAFFNRSDDIVKIRPLACFEFGMEQFAIGANFESAAAGRNQGERFDPVTEFKNFRRQTDGLRRVVSNDAVFD